MAQCNAEKLKSLTSNFFHMHMNTNLHETQIYTNLSFGIRYWKSHPQSICHHVAALERAVEKISGKFLQKCASWSKCDVFDAPPVLLHPLHYLQHNQIQNNDPQLAWTLLTFSVEKPGKVAIPPAEY